MPTSPIADELKRLTGKTAKPHHLGLMPGLRQAAGVSDEVSLVPAGCAVRKYLESRIGSIAEPVEFQGRQYQPEVMRRVFRLLLGLDGSSQTAPNRRGRVILLLDLHYGVEMFRKNPEAELMALLAELL